ncbi:hypothetical protein E4T42_03913 [Aureobasidium subglaciale]|nr:hypothetical protein E4T42_03913 [Aureobasidium subglaciale]
MIEPPWSLEGALEIDWTLSRPCIVSWTDINLETKTLGVEPQTVTLWFGVEPKSRVWIVLLRITLRFKISVRSIPFDFYIFVDPHSFQISKDPLAALSPELIDLPELHAAKSEHGWLSAIVQQQNHTQPAGLVLMKHQPPGNKPWSGTSLHLLSLVYSLSTAPEFKIYLGNESNRRNHRCAKSRSTKISRKTSTQPSQSRDFPPWSSLKRAADTQESESSLKRIVRLARDSFPDCTPTEANTSIREGWSQQSAQVDMSSEQEQSTQSQSPRDNNHIRLTPGRLQTPEHKNPLPPYEDDETPPYIAHSSSPESLDRRCMKPTIFTRQYPIDASPKPTDLEVIVAATIQAQMPTIVAQVYNQIKLNETATLAQTTIDKHVAIHMPTMMQATLTAHLSDVNDEFESASGELQEVKDDAITEMRSARDDVLKELEEEIQVVHVEYRERVSELREEVFVDISDKMTEFEARIEAKTSVATPPAYGSVVPGTINRLKDAVKAFRDTYQVSLTSEQQVMVLLSFVQYSNAEVFMEADQESKRLLVAHWAGAESNTPELSLTLRINSF